MNEQLIALEFLQPNPYQPRQHEDQAVVIELANNILHNATEDFDGLLQVPTARAIGEGHYQLAFGHTRKAAFAYLFNQGNSVYGRMRVNVRELSDVQMFEAAVAENIKRRDLNPIEQAESMHRYMTEFSKTSKEAGEFFNCSEENVRAKVRLLNLPEPVQEKMRAGEVNENTARSILSMQKVASENVIIETLKQIKQRGDEYTPEQVIDHAVERLDNVTELWNDNRRDGKPRAGYHGWLLDMKNFPNKLLEHLAPGDYVELGFVKKDQLTTIHTDYSLGDKDADLPADLKAKIDHLSNPPACTACAFYTKIRGSHYCGVKACYERKTAAWMQYQLEQTSKSTGIALYTESDGRYSLLVSHDDKCNALFAKKHADLRLVPKSKISGYQYQHFQGVDDDVCFVVAVGDTLAKLGSSATKSVGGQKSEKEKAEMRAMRIYRARRKELLWECTGVAKALFDGLPFDALDRINGWHFIGIDDRIPDEYEPADNAKENVKAEFERRALVWRLLVGDTSHYSRCSMADILETLQVNTKIKPPKALIKLAEQWDAEIDAVASGVAVKK